MKVGTVIKPFMWLTVLPMPGIILDEMVTGRAVTHIWLWIPMSIIGAIGTLLISWRFPELDREFSMTRDKEMKTH